MMAKRKIGILTYMKEYVNHGTNTQSYSTFKAIKDAYPNDRVEIINYSSWKPSKRPYLSQISPRSIINDIRRINCYDSFFKVEMNFSQQKLISNSVEESLRFIDGLSYDAIYVGADTLLELKRAKPDEITPYYLGSSIKTNKVLIAASANNVVPGTLSKKQRILMEESLRGFKFLGVRDIPTMQLVRNIVGVEDPRIELVPDPTFTYEIDYSYVMKYLERKKLEFNKPIVCFHLLRNCPWANTLATMFKKAGYIVASIRPAYYADILLNDLGPHEQAGVYKYFDLVITHRYHDSIFSIKNLTPVIFYPEFPSDVSTNGESKTRVMFRRFGIESTNYLEDPLNLTANIFFDRSAEAINFFRSNCESIVETLNELKNEYVSYVDKTKRLCFNS